LYSSKEIQTATVKVSDFGLARYVTPEGMASTTCGTPGYVAPEIIAQQKYGKECDYWSIGIVLYILLCGYPPFFDTDNMKLFEKIKTGKFSFPDEGWSQVSEEAKDLLKKILCLDPKDRLTPEQMLEHPWFSMDLTGTPQRSEMIAHMRSWNSKDQK